AERVTFADLAAVVNVVTSHPDNAIEGRKINRNHSARTAEFDRFRACRYSDEDRWVRLLIGSGDYRDTPHVSIMVDLSGCTEHLSDRSSRKTDQARIIWIWNFIILAVEAYSLLCPACDDLIDTFLENLSVLSIIGAQPLYFITGRFAGGVAGQSLLARL